MKRETRLAVFEKFPGRCAYCGCEINIQSMQVDHVHPKVAGGTDEMRNLLPSCRPCNNYKLFFGLEEFRTMIANQIALLRRNATNFRHAERYGLVQVTVPDKITFYFERAGEESHG